MKRIFTVLTFILLFCCATQVNAACASGVNIGEESICLVEGSNTQVSGGTAYAEGTTLVLNNYNGGNISYFFMTTPFTIMKIKLIGDNYINASDDYGLLIPKNGVEFIGNGTLTINSKLSFAIVNDWTKYNLNEEEIILGDNVSKIKVSAGTSDSVNNGEIINNNNQNVENNAENDIDTNINLILIICCVVCVLCTIIITILYFNKKR